MRAIVSTSSVPQMLAIGATTTRQAMQGTYPADWKAAGKSSIPGPAMLFIVNAKDANQPIVFAPTAVFALLLLLLLVGA